jgi:hypothetical protein
MTAWWDAWRPTRLEAEREAIEERLADTWEERYQSWCREEGLDPEATENIHAYEEEWSNGFTE